MNTDVWYAHHKNASGSMAEWYEEHKVSSKVGSVVVGSQQRKEIDMRFFLEMC